MGAKVRDKYDRNGVCSDVFFFSWCVFFLWFPPAGCLRGAWAHTASSRHLWITNEQNARAVGFSDSSLSVTFMIVPRTQPTLSPLAKTMNSQHFYHCCS